MKRPIPVQHIPTVRKTLHDLLAIALALQLSEDKTLDGRTSHQLKELAPAPAVLDLLRCSRVLHGDGVVVSIKLQAGDHADDNTAIEQRELSEATVSLPGHPFEVSVVAEGHAVDCELGEVLELAGAQIIVRPFPCRT